MNKFFSVSCCFVAVFMLSGFARGSIVVGDLVGPGDAGLAPGVYNDNDSLALIESITGMTLTQLDKVDLPATLSGGLSISDPGSSGTWNYTPLATEVVDYIVAKAGNFFALYQFTDANTNSMRNTGLWTTAAIDPFHPGPNPPNLSHLTAYSITASTIPEPTSALVWLLMSYLAFSRLNVRTRAA